METAMKEFSAGNYGDRFADVFDRLQLPPDLQSCVNNLANIATGGSALELGVGTGRVALPLAQQDCRVPVVDNSEKMLGKLREKAGANQLSIIRGDFTNVPVDVSL
jgi:ubiquinone/menaquinone biosynthesis C-methylase UbiE